MHRAMNDALDRVGHVVDWCIPGGLKTNLDVTQGVRMFVFSHLFGPFLGHTVSLYTLYAQGHASLEWWVLFVAITAFWIYNPVLRKTRSLGQYVLMTFVSIQNLLFCILWGIYWYGGIHSPHLPWLVTVPLLAFFYLPQGRYRLYIGGLIFANLLIFATVALHIGFPADPLVDDLAGLGFVSCLSAGLYVAMMALYHRRILFSKADLEREVLQHRETDRLLREATERANRAIRAKAEFLANMSHELRTPLTAIIGYSELLMEEESDATPQWQDLHAIHAAGRNLLRRINDLLDLSKLEAGKMDVAVEWFAVDAFLDDVAAQWRPMAAAKGTELRVDAVPDKVGLDGMKLRRILDALLDNAVKFTDGGRIAVAARRDDDGIVLTVEDTGCGIAPEETAHLFDYFHIREGETTSGYREPALGLPLGRLLATLLGGTLTVESMVGKGTRATLRLPRAQARAEPAAPKLRLVG